MSEKGSIVEGKISGIRRFGAFVDLESGEKGLIHISNIASEYVKNVDDYLKVGQPIKAKVLGITKDGKVDLTLKGLDDSAVQPVTVHRKSASAHQKSESESEDTDFEKKLSKFMKDSEKKISEFRRARQKKTGKRGR